MTPAAQREAVAYVCSAHSLSERRACRLVGAARATVRYAPRTVVEDGTRERLRERARMRPRFGSRRLTVLLRRERGTVNHKRVYRLYREEGLQVRRRRRKHLARTARATPPLPLHAGALWAMDCMQDALASGRRFRTLNVVDACTRECLAIEGATSLPGQRVVRLLERLAVWHGLPRTIRVDNGPEFAGLALDAWAHAKGVPLDCITPGRPTENGGIESGSGKCRDECRDQYWFGDLREARRVIEGWRRDDNHERPHRALRNVPPATFAAALQREALSQ